VKKPPPPPLLVLSPLLFVLACSSHNPAQPCLVQPPTVITISAAQVGVPFKPYDVGSATGAYTVCGSLPPGMTIASASGELWLTGTPAAAGNFRFWLQPQ
jgi:hypothetical protein